MVRETWRSVALIVACSFFAIGGAEASGLSGRFAQGGIVLNEVQYDPAPSGSESRYEWVELHNPGGGEVPLAGWRIADHRAETIIPDVSIPPGGFLVVAGEGFAELFPEFAGTVVTVGRIGNGLGNDGDLVRLLDAGGGEVDALSYGSDAGAFDPPVPGVAAGHSLERVPAGVDTDTAADWVDQPAPSPGRAGSAERPTAVPTAAPAPTLAPGTRVVLNEYLPAPRDIDWDGNGTAGPDDEWIELYNAGDTAVDLRGWQIDDVADGGSAPFVITDTVALPARGYRVYFNAQTGVSLNNGGDAVRLLTPDGVPADVSEYARSTPDGSWARDGDGAGPWTADLAPSPGGPNRDGVAPAPTAAPPAEPTSPPVAPTPTPLDPPVEPTPSPDPTRPTPPIEPTPPDEPTPGSPAPPTAAPSPPPSPTGTSPGTPPPPSIYLPILVSEILFDPIETGLDVAHEWVEIVNAGDAPVGLLGWAVGDGGGWDTLPGAVVLPARAHLVIAATEETAAAVRGSGAAAIAIGDGRIGNGLANGGDVVRLRGPTGAVVDAVSWGSNLDAFDPAVPHGPPGSSIERLPSDVDTDTADDWWIQPAPSPGREGELHTAPPPLLISEALPAPSNVDWDGDGAAGHLDEFVELHNPAAYAVDLGRWVVADGESDGWEHRFEPGVRIGAGRYLAVFRTTSGIALDNDADTVRLVRPDGVEADRLTWSAGPGYDRSLSRTDLAAGTIPADAGGEWSSQWAVTPGAPNRPLEPGEAHPADVAWDARREAMGWTTGRGGRRATAGREGEEVRFAVALADIGSVGRRTRVVVRGRVTAPPGVFGPREVYIGDEAGGVRLYLRRADHAHRPFVLGDPVAAIGTVADFRGERQVVLDRPEDSWWDGAGGAVEPVAVRTGQVGEALEGRVIVVHGRVVAFSRLSYTLDDGSGPARVVIRPATGLQRPWVERGEWRSAIGIVGQSAERAPWEGGYRITPRLAADLDPPIAGPRSAPIRLAPSAAERGVRDVGRRAASTGRAIERSGLGLAGWREASRFGVELM